MPDFTRVSMIDVSSHDPATAFVAGKRYQLDDRAPYIWKTHDYGKTWARITNGIPASNYVHAVREDPSRRGLLYAGTEHGVYVSFDEGTSWQSLSLNLPDTQVSDLVVEARDLVIATHGRSFYVLDDIAPIRQLTAAVMESAAHLFQPADAVRRVHPATIDYYVKNAAARIAVEIVDGNGRPVRSLRGKSMDTAGAHRLTWDLRYPGATVFEGMILRSAQPERGPFAPPGPYAVRLTIDGQIQTRDFIVAKDPRLTDVSDADLREQFDLSLQIRDKTSAANEAVIAIRDVTGQVQDRLTKTSDKDLAAKAHAFVRRLTAIEEELYQVRLRSPKDVFNYPVKLNNRLAALSRTVQGADARPTDQTYTVFKQLAGDVDGLVTKLDAVLKDDLPSLNRLLSGLRLDPIRTGNK